MKKAELSLKLSVDFGRNIYFEYSSKKKVYLQIYQIRPSATHFKGFAILALIKVIHFAGYVKGFLDA